MNWQSPLPYVWQSSTDSQSFERIAPPHGIIPTPPHVGSFGAQRKHHIHEGVDLYAPHKTPISAVEEGVVVAIEPFTGAAVDSPWWHDTFAVFVEGGSGVVVYGEIEPQPDLVVGQSVQSGQILGCVVPVLKVNKGRPMSMLHLELHTKNTRQAVEWSVGEPKPATLLDPTSLLLTLVK